QWLHERPSRRRADPADRDGPVGPRHWRRAVDVGIDHRWYNLGAAAVQGGVVLKIGIPTNCKIGASQQRLQLAAEHRPHDRTLVLVVLMEDGVVVIDDERDAARQSKRLKKCRETGKELVLQPDAVSRTSPEHMPEAMSVASGEAHL